MKAELNRRLAAIMFTDMVGYTALMQQDENLGQQKRSRHREVFKKCHKIYNGEIVQYFGDGTLSVFSSSVNAVKCAVAMQQELKAPIEVPLRIGIHSGNIVLEKEGIIGDAVNIASRIESFGNVGGVLISDSMYDQVKNQSWDFLSLGKFNLKNVDRPYEIFAIIAEGLTLPDPNFLSGKGEKIAILKGHVPVSGTPILGREVQVKELIDLLDKHQVVTITGTGGVGKTRISLEICQRLKATFQDGIAFVSMATLTDATEVMPTLAIALGVTEAAGRELIDGLVAIISDKKALLVLDNLEQVISASQEIAGLVVKCPNLKILCTSRTPLKIIAEQEYVLHPLPLPSQNEMDSLLSYSAIELFVSHAKKVNKDFEMTSDNASTVVEICRRMDGLPLALELAAARIRILPPDQLLRRLSRALDVLTTGSKDLPERHQTLRATIDWSYSLLNDPEQKLFRRLAVFAGGFTLESVEFVCYTDEDDNFLAFDEIESLLDKGLVEKVEGGARFNLLQTINDFAMEKLEASGESDSISYRHALHFFEVAKMLSEGTQGQQQAKRMKQGALEEANYQVTLAYLLERAQAGNKQAQELGLLICSELWMYWHIKGKHNTAKEYVNSFFRATDDQAPSLGKCGALSTLFVATFTLGEIEDSYEVAMRHYEMAEQLKDDLEMTKGCMSMGFGLLLIDLEASKKYSDEAVVRSRAMKNDYWLGFTLWQNGVINLVRGDLDSAKDCHSKSFALFQKIGDEEGKGCARSGLALVDFITEDYENSLAKYQEALSAFEAVGDHPEKARVLNEMSWTYLAAKNTILAQKYTLDSIQAYQEVGSPRGIGLSLNGLAAIEALEGRPKKAIEIAASAQQFAEQEGVVIEFGANNHGQIYLDNAKKELSELEIANAEKTGRMLSLKEVLSMTENSVTLIA